jgi:hypothetical protein
MRKRERERREREREREREEREERKGGADRSRREEILRGASGGCLWED